MEGKSFIEKLRIFIVFKISDGIKYKKYIQGNRNLQICVSASVIIGIATTIYSMVGGPTIIELLQLWRDSVSDEVDHNGLRKTSQKFVNTSNLIKDAQLILTRKGCYAGPVNGKITHKLQSAFYNYNNINNTNLNFQEINIDTIIALNSEKSLTCSDEENLCFEADNGWIVCE